MAGIHLSDDASMSRVSTFHDLNARWTTKDRDAIRSHSVKKAQAPGGSRCVLAAYLTILHRNKYSEFSINSRDGIGIGIEYPYCLCLSKRGDFTNMNECTPPSLSSTSGFDVGCEFNERTRTLLLLFFVARRMNAF